MCPHTSKLLPWSWRVKYDETSPKLFSYRVGRASSEEFSVAQCAAKNGNQCLKQQFMTRYEAYLEQCCAVIRLPPHFKSIVGVWWIFVIEGDMPWPISFTEATPPVTRPQWIVHQRHTQTAAKILFAWGPPSVVLTHSFVVELPRLERRKVFGHLK